MRFLSTKVLVVNLFLFFFVSSVYSQTLPGDNKRERVKEKLPVVHQLYSNFATAKHSPGIVYGIMIGDELVDSGSIGFANIEKRILATPKTAFRIASMSKSITAMAILQLRDKGKLKLDDPAYLYIPAMSRLKYLTEDAPAITVRNLLTHAGGFPEDNPWGDRQLSDSDAELLQLIENGVSFSTVPGTAYEYSNLGFALLGQIIKNVSGQPYQEYITNNIFKPLGMNDTYWEFSKVPQDRLALGYRWLNESWKAEEMLHDGSYGAMGGIITTLENFSKYVALHMKAWPEGKENETKVLKNSSLREMHFMWNFSGLNTQASYPSGRNCAMATGYGYGLGITRDCEGRNLIGHAGGLPGFGSNWTFLPEYGIAVILFSNVTYAPTTIMNREVIDTLVRMAALKPRTLKPSAVLEQRKNELLPFLPDWKDAGKSAIFAENFFADNLIEELKAKAKKAFAAAGKVIKVSPVTARNNLRGNFLVEGEKRDIQVFFTLSPEEPPLIQAFSIRTLEKQRSSQ